MKKLWKKKATFVIIGLTILLLAVTSHAQSTRYTIVDKTVYINDTNAYISASPYRIIDSGWVEINMESKTYSGYINVLLGVNSSKVQPKQIQRYNPHNVTTEESFTCDKPNYFYNYTTSPKHFWCWANSTFDSVTYTDLVFEHDFDYANLSTSTAYWNETYVEDWETLDNIVDKKITYDFDEKDTWYYASHVPVTSGSKYRIWMDVPIGFNEKGKYDLAFYPSSYGTNIQQANQDGNLYYLDPWWDSSWGACVNVTSSGTATESGWFTHVLPINSTNVDHSKVQAGGIDFRIVYGNCSSPEINAVALPMYIQHYNSSGISFLYFNSTAGKTNFALYYNNSGASDISDITGVAYAWDTGDLSANSSTPSNGNLLVGAGGWLADYSSQNEWTYSNTMSFSGTLSMKHDASSGGARVYFNSGSSASKTVEMWIYDQSTDTNGVFILNKDNPAHGGSDKGWEGVFGEGGITTNYANYDGTWASIGKPRSTGWHKMILKSDGTTVNFYYANLTDPYEQFIENVTQSVSTISTTVDSRSQTNPYFDDVIVRPYSYKDNTYTFSDEETTAVADTCTYSGSGNWAIDCTDACVISTDTDLSKNNITFSGVGTVYITAIISNFTYAGTLNSCHVIAHGGGGLRG